MATDFPQGWAIKDGYGEWGIDMDWRASSFSFITPSGDGAFRFLNTTPTNNPTLAQMRTTISGEPVGFWLEADAIYRVSTKVYSGSIAGGDTMQVYARRYLNRSPFVWIDTYAINGVLGAASTWEYHEAYFRSDSDALAATIYISKANNAFTAYVDHVLVERVRGAFRAYLNVDESITSGVWGKIPFDQETFDHTTLYDSVTNFRFDVPYTSRWRIGAGARFEAMADGNLCVLRLSVNGSPSSYLGRIVTGGAGDVQLVGSDVLYLTTGDYVEVEAFHDFGTPFVSTRDILAGEDWSYFSADEVGL